MALHVADATLKSIAVVTSESGQTDDNAVSGFVKIIITHI